MTRLTPAHKALAAFIILVVILGLGYAWGAAGRGALRATAEESKQRLDALEARGAILEARVSLYNNNFGDASRHFEESKEALRRLKARYEDDGAREAAASVDTALRHVEEGQRLAAKLDPAAQNLASQALEALRDIRRP